MRYLIAFTLSLTAALAGCVDPNSLANGNGDLAIDDLAFFDCPPDTCDDMSKAFPPACSDNMKDGDETDVDCGGSCPACAAGKSCAKGKDCQSTFCTNTLCAAPSCMDQVKNGTETDVDCGGSCPGCSLGKACTFATDCASMTCTNGACAPSPCTNGIKDGMETDIDCGGPVCSPCADNKACLIGADCTGGICTNQLCKSPIQCMAPMANCDNNPMSGCNINLNTDAKNCGKCGMVCPMNMANCSGGKCVVGAKVLIISNGPAMNYQDVQSKLMATGSFSVVDVADEGQSTPTVGQMQMHDVVFVYTEEILQDPTTLGNNLATYFDAGGRVVLAYAANGGQGNIFGPSGAFAANGYLLTGPGTLESENDSLGTVNEPNSPLMAGVKSLSGKAIGVSNGSLINGAISVVDWHTTKLPLIVTGVIKGRNRVDLNFWPPSADVAGDEGWTGDGAIIMRNALLYQ